MMIRQIIRQQGRQGARVALAGVALAAVLTLSGCGEGVAREKIRDTLVEKGVPAPQASCMADNMVQRLSISQLRKLKAIKGHTQSPSEAMMALQKIDDPQVVQVTVAAAALCLSGLGH